MAEQNENSLEDRNEPATPFRRQQFRDQGQVAMSRELISVALLVGVGGVLYVFMQKIFIEMSGLSHRFFNVSRFEMDKEAFLNLGREALGSWAWVVAPLLGVGLVVGFAASSAQVGFHLTWEPMAPNWDRVNPISGFQRIFSLRAIVEAVKAMFKLAVGLLVLWFFLSSQATHIGVFLHQGVPEIVAYTLKSVANLFFSTLGVLLFLAALDYGYQRWQLEKEMRMTRREAKEEYKLREGDPLIKQRIRSVQRKIASRRMMEDVPKADVIVTNPTHFAVALQYDRAAMAAPKVVAKGAGLIAQKIKELARKHSVPIVENKPLARTLFKTIDIGGFIPRELYKAVAEVLAYVYRLKGIRKLVNG
ncbi:MAG: flagellar biosynthesis protein FlhB [Bdellovibrionales bacterium]|nr:flagellar biosynthesis protein FlhB [Bdellovibrionales bacterium]